MENIILMNNSISKKDITRSILYINIAVLLYGTSGVMSRYTEVSSSVLTFGRVFVSTCVLLIYSLIVKKDLKLKNKRDFIILMAAGAVLGFHFLTFFVSIRLSTVAIATITYAAAPLFMVFLDHFVYGAKLTKKSLIMTILIIVGVSITCPDISFENSMFMGLLVGLLSAFLYGILTVLNNEVASKYDSTTVTLYQQAAASLTTLPFAFITFNGLNATDIAVIGFIGVVITAVAFAMFVSTQRYLSVQTVGIVSIMETVYGIILAAVFLHEIPSRGELIGGLIVLSVVIYAQLDIQKN